MCGIAGLVNVRSGPAPTRQELSAMIGALRHRGPDGSGYYSDERAGLAHARLAIIDLAGGNQPMEADGGRIQVVFNGEIFNFVELRRDLESQGAQFRTNSDTEVILHLYSRDGLDFVQALNGQFAIALWDRDLGRLLLVRDRVGIRPLYHASHQGRLWFASEIKSLLGVPGVSGRVSARALAEVFTFWSVQPPGTPFEGVEALPPGCMLVVDTRAETRRLIRYWDWAFPAGKIPESRPAADLADELRALLSDSVRIQLRADVPVGAYLSGGLDSSIVATLARAQIGTRLRTFSLGFEDPEFDESLRQQEMVEFLGSHHTQVACSKADIRDAFPQAVWHAESPIVRTAPVPMLVLAGHVRSQGYKVVLSGEGADEVFGGYDLFKEARIRRFWARRPDSALRPRILDRLYPYLAHAPAGAPAFARQFFRQGFERPGGPTFGHLPRWSTTRRAWRFFSSDLTAELGSWDPISELEARLPEDFARWESLCRDQYIEAHTLLSGYLLSAQGDRMAMAHSIEARHPFLDHRLIEFAAGLPTRLKLMGLKEKYLLRKAVEPFLPPQTAWRPKQPYRAPDSHSFFFEGKPPDYVGDMFSPSTLRRYGLFDPQATSRLYQKCMRGEAIGFADNMAFVGILSTQLIADTFRAGVPQACLAG